MTLSKSHSQARTNLHKPQLLFLFSTYETQNASSFSQTDSAPTTAIPDLYRWFTSEEEPPHQHIETPLQNQTATLKTSEEKSGIQAKN